MTTTKTIVLIAGGYLAYKYAWPIIKQKVNLPLLPCNPENGGGGSNQQTTNPIQALLKSFADLIEEVTGSNTTTTDTKIYY